MITLGRITIHPALVCPQCAHKIGASALHSVDEEIELRCLACHTSVVKIEIEVPEWEP